MSLEQTHIKTVEESIEILHTDDYNHRSLINRLNQLVGYLKSTEEIKQLSNFNETSKISSTL
jgi:hypothetical protein